MKQKDLIKELSERCEIISSQYYAILKNYIELQNKYDKLFKEVKNGKHNKNKRQN